MSDDIKISVIVPVYNKEQYIEKCIESIVSQKLQEIEIICINDGSTDRSLSKLRELEEHNSNLRVIDQSNQGVGAARNNGIQSSRGEYISFMDADDFYPDNDTLGKLYRKAKENNALICGGSFSSLKNGDVITEYEGMYSGYTFEKEGMMDYSEYQYDFGFQRFIYSRRLLMDNGIKFPNLIRFQDPPFLVDAMIHAGEFYAVREPTYRYREDYKSVGWNLVKKTDMLKGLIHNLKASKEKYQKLNELTYRRLTSEYYREILLDQCNGFEKAVIGDLLKDALENVDQTIDSTVLKKMICDFEPYDDGDEPDVTIIIPVYKVEKYIDECLNSVLEQIDPPKLQIICVDDGSPDRSGMICEQYSGKDNRILTIHKKNGGLSSARNAGMDYVEGKYVYFLDSDDKLRPDALKSMFDIMEKNGLEVLFFDAKTFYDSPKLERTNASYKGYYCNRGEPGKIVRGSELMSMFDANNTYRTPVQLTMIRRDFYESHGLGFYDGILHEDNLFTFKCLLESDRAMYINEEYYMRRIRDGSIMTTKVSFRNYRGYIRCLIEMRRYMRDHADFVEGYSIIKRLEKTAVSAYAGLDNSQKKKMSGMPIDEILVGLELGIDPYSGTNPYVSVYVGGPEKELDMCIKNLNVQSVPIKVFLVDSKVGFPGCKSIQNKDVKSTMEQDGCILKIMMDSPVILRQDALLSMLTLAVVEQKSTDLLGDIKIFDRQKVITTFSSEEYVGDVCITGGRSIIDYDSNDEVRFEKVQKRTYVERLNEWFNSLCRR
ncbi:MAG: glycosyltransferase [Candidatus Methanomethylophilaceae archaeon]|nr:glycosyltransferase [Candidatus Methanomethylophilaceae archaeon]